MRFPSPALVVLVGPSGAGKSTWAAGTVRGRRGRLERPAAGGGRRGARTTSPPSPTPSHCSTRSSAARLRRGLTAVVDTLGLDPTAGAAGVELAAAPRRAAPSRSPSTRPADVPRPQPRRGRGRCPGDVLAAPAAAAPDGAGAARPTRASPRCSAVRCRVAAAAGAGAVGGRCGRRPTRRPAAPLRAARRRVRLAGRRGAALRRRASGASRPRRRRRVRVALGDGPPAPDPAGRPGVGGPAGVAYDARLARRLHRRRGRRLVPASPTATSRCSARPSPRSTCCPAAAPCAASARPGSRRSTAPTACRSRRCASATTCSRTRSSCCRCCGGPARRRSRAVIDVPEAVCYPRPLQERVPIVVGGQGERRTLRLAAGTPTAATCSATPRRSGASSTSCTGTAPTAGRDPAAIEVTHLSTALVAATADDSRGSRRASARAASPPSRYAASVGAGTVAEHVRALRGAPTRACRRRSCGSPTSAAERSDRALRAGHRGVLSRTCLARSRHQNNEPPVVRDEVDEADDDGGRGEHDAHLRPAGHVPGQRADPGQEDRRSASPSRGRGGDEDEHADGPGRRCVGLSLVLNARSVGSAAHRCLAPGGTSPAEPRPCSSRRRDVPEVPGTSNFTGRRRGTSTCPWGLRCATPSRARHVDDITPRARGT